MGERADVVDSCKTRSRTHFPALANVSVLTWVCVHVVCVCVCVRACTRRYRICHANVCARFYVYYCVIRAHPLRDVMQSARRKKVERNNNNGAKMMCARAFGGSAVVNIGFGGAARGLCFYFRSARQNDEKKKQHEIKRINKQPARFPCIMQRRPRRFIGSSGFPRDNIVHHASRGTSSAPHGVTVGFWPPLTPCAITT